MMMMMLIHSHSEGANEILIQSIRFFPTHVQADGTMEIPLHAQLAATHYLLRPKITWQSMGLEDGNKLGCDEGLQSFAQNGPKLASTGSLVNVQAVAAKVAVLP